MLYRPAEGFPNGKCCIHELNAKCSNQNSVFISQILQSTHIFLNFSGTCVIECTVYEWWRIRGILTKTRIHIYPLKEWNTEITTWDGITSSVNVLPEFDLGLEATGTSPSGSSVFGEEQRDESLEDFLSRSPDFLLSLSTDFLETLELFRGRLEDFLLWYCPSSFLWVLLSLLPTELVLLSLCPNEPDADLLSFLAR